MHHIWEWKDLGDYLRKYGAINAKDQARASSVFFRILVRTLCPLQSPKVLSSHVVRPIERNATQMVLGFFVSQAVQYSCVERVHYLGIYG
jgi:hypothetical protein